MSAIDDHAKDLLGDLECYRKVRNDDYGGSADEAGDLDTVREALGSYAKACVDDAMRAAVRGVEALQSQANDELTELIREMTP